MEGGGHAFLHPHHLILTHTRLPYLFHLCSSTHVTVAREKWKFPVIPAALQVMLLLLLVSRLSLYLLFTASRWPRDLMALLLNLAGPGSLKKIFLCTLNNLAISCTDFVLYF